MIAELKSLHSPDVGSGGLENFCPDKSDSFSILVQAAVGVIGASGSDSFDFEVCTPKWLSRRIGEGEILVGRHIVLVEDYNYSRLRLFVEKYISDCKGSSWEEVAEKVGRLGRWEFEDYVD